MNLTSRMTVNTASTSGSDNSMLTTMDGTAIWVAQPSAYIGVANSTISTDYYNDYRYAGQASRRINLDNQPKVKNKEKKVKTLYVYDVRVVNIAAKVLAGQSRILMTLENQSSIVTNVNQLRDSVLLQYGSQITGLLDGVDMDNIAIDITTKGAYPIREEEKDAA